MSSTDQPTSVATESRSLLLDALEVGYPDKVACAIAGFDFPSYERWLKRGSSEECGEYHDFSEQVSMAKCCAINYVETVFLRGIADGDVRLALRWLQIHDPETWGPNARPDLAPWNAPVPIPVRSDTPAIEAGFRRLAPAERGGTETAAAGNPVWGLDEALSFSNAVMKVLADITIRQGLVEQAERGAALGGQRDQAELTAEIQSDCERVLHLACEIAERYGAGAGGADSSQPLREPPLSADRASRPQSDGGSGK